MLPRFTELFLAMYDSYELLARNEARRLGREVLNAEPAAAPNRDRLEKGVPWAHIADRLARQLQTPLTQDLANFLSLVLDVCNDLGVAVPITCSSGQTTFRAYRHGEDVHFSDAELALAQECARGFLEASGRSDIPRVVLEKLLVLLIRVGAARGFLEPHYGLTGAEGTVHIAFSLQGAVPVIGAGEGYVPDRPPWLADYLVERDVLRETRKGGNYVLGVPLEGNCAASHAPWEARKLGALVGRLLPASVQAGGTQALGVEDLATLCTCFYPRDVAAALNAELGIYRRWLRDRSHRLKRINWSDADQLRQLLASLVQSHGYEALQAARQKYQAFHENACSRILSLSCGCFGDTPDGRVLAGEWESYWGSLRSDQDGTEENTFEPWIQRAAEACWGGATYLAVMEYALSLGLARLVPQRGRSPERVLRKMDDYARAMSSAGLALPRPAARLVHRVAAWRSSGPGHREHETLLATALNSAAGEELALGRLTQSLGDVVEEFGRLAGRHDYAYLVYYDVKDSTATKADRNGEDVALHRERVAQFQRSANQVIADLTYAARKRDCEIFCWNGAKSSTNDAKHVFLAGKRARRHAEQLLSALLECTASSPGVNIRVYAAPCSFAGTKAFRYRTDTEVGGRRFWEHWSRLAKKCEELERECDPDRSFLVLATPALIDHVRLSASLRLPQAKRVEVETGVAGLSRKTEVHYGAVEVSVRQLGLL